jgi:hypothetical protein
MIFKVVDLLSPTDEGVNEIIYLNNTVPVGDRTIKLFSIVKKEIKMVSGDFIKKSETLVDVNLITETPKPKVMKLF